MASSMENKPFTIALAGNPNCGKTTIFNALTGSNQHVGNYSGVTVEKKEGSFKFEGHEVTVIDLPGTYSLNYHSPEERIAQEELLSGKVNLLVAIVDSGSLSRCLLFIAQLMQLHLPMVLVLNMWDEAQKSGIKLDIKKMTSLLGMPVIPTIASKKTGIDELKAAIFDHDNWQVPAHRLRLGDVITETLKRIIEKLPKAYENQDEWVATKLLLNDEKYNEEIQKLPNGAEIIALARKEREHIQADTKMDIQLYVTEQYYGYVNGMLKEVTLNTEVINARELSDKVDKVLVHPILGLPIFFAIVFVLFYTTFTLGAYPMEWIEAGFEALAGLCDGMADGLLKSLIVDGIIGGVGGVIVFLPNILILFLGLSFLEDTGYMARTAFLMDRLMHRVGLHGRSFIPLITGFGCSVPGLMATRTIAGEKERLTTMYILPLMSCGARLPIWLLLVPVFFVGNVAQTCAMMGIYLLGVVIALGCAFVLRKTAFKGQEEPFVMELPPYRMPTARAVITHMFERGWLYLKKAGTIILPISIVLWALAAWHPGYDEAAEEAVAQRAVETVQAEYAEQIKELAGGQSFEDFMKSAEEAVAAAEEAEEAEDAEEKADSDKTPEEKLADLQAEVVGRRDGIVEEAELENSALGYIGKAVGVVLSPMGFDWKIATAVVGAFAAKEVFVAQMGIVYSLGEVDEEDEGLRDTLRSTYPLATGLALIVWLLISAPCMATFAVMKRESGSWKHAVLQFTGLTLLAFVLATIVNLVACAFGLGVIS